MGNQGGGAGVFHEVIGGLLAYRPKTLERRFELLRYARLALLLLILLVVLPAPTRAKKAPTGLQMTAEAAFEGRFKFGYWLPLYITLENAGSTFTGSVRARVTGPNGTLDFVAPVELTPGGRKRVTLYVLPNNFSRELAVDLTQAGEILLSHKVKVSALPNDRYVMGVVAADADPLTTFSSLKLPGRRERPHLITFSLGDLPERPEGLGLLNALILNDVDTGSLTPQQQAALQQWVLGGGRLIIGGGSGTARTLAGLPAALRPVQLLGQQEVAVLPALETFAGEPIRVPGPFLLAETVLTSPARHLIPPLSENRAEIPLAVEQALGRGFVNFIALDLTGSPFDAWAGFSLMAEQLLSPGAAWPEFAPPDIAPHQMRDSQLSSALTNLPALDLPSIRLLSILLAGYILLVGPLNYFLLRWRDKLAWAWLTIPGLTLAFSGLAYGVSYQLRGSDIIVNQLSLVELSGDGQVADTQTYVGIFSPSRQTYDVAVEGASLLRPLGEGYYDPWSGEVSRGTMSVVQSDPAQVQGLTVNQWSMQSFVAETSPALPLRLEGQIEAGRDRLTGSLTHHAGAPLLDAVVIFGSQFQKLGDLTPGQTVDLELKLDQATGITGFGSYMLFQEQVDRAGMVEYEINFKQSVIDGVIFNPPFMGPTPAVILIGWVEDSPLTVTVQGQEVSHQKTSFVYGHLPIIFDQTKVVIPPGFTKATLVKSSENISNCNQGPGREGVYFEAGQAEVKLTLPEAGRNLELSRLDLYLQSDYFEAPAEAAPNLELFDRTEQRWVPLAGAKLGVNPITNPARFFDPAEASLRARLSRPEFSQFSGCIFFNLAVEGGRS